MRTLSPTTSLINLLRILPEIWANTKCPPASSTLNIVPANTDTIMPSISTDLSSRPSLSFLPLLLVRPALPPRAAGDLLAGLFGFPAMVFSLVI